MNIDELIEELQHMKTMGCDGNTEVRFASQPSWPFEYSIAGIHSITPEERQRAAEEEMRESGMTDEEIAENLDYDEIVESRNVVYLEEGSQLGYLPGDVKEILGW